VPQYTRQACVTVPSGPDGPTATVVPKVEVYVSGLQIPWGLAWLPNGDLLVTERTGALRLVKGGQLQSTPVTTVAVAQFSSMAETGALGTEGGLLGLVLHPDFANNHSFFMYWEAGADTNLYNRLALYKLSADGTTATLDHMVLDNIPAGVHHQGGRLRIGPDGKLYVPVGAYDPSFAQMPNQYPGKLLRMNLDGSIPNDNPTPGSYVYVTGIRNTEGYDWFNKDYMLLMDHGPTGIDTGVPQKGLDEFNVVRARENLGWPNVIGCNTATGMTPPVMMWTESTPPGGAEIYRGNAIPAWTGSFMFATLGLYIGTLWTGEGQDLHLIKVSPDNPYVVQKHEVYLRGQYGRLRTVATGPDGYLYVTTSNCDFRGQGNGLCTQHGDQILRITGAM
jgi:glucose/arabinose dehydrogenase